MSNLPKDLIVTRSVLEVARPCIRNELHRCELQISSIKKAPAVEHLDPLRYLETLEAEANRLNATLDDIDTILKPPDRPLYCKCAFTDSDGTFVPGEACQVHPDVVPQREARTADPKAPCDCCRLYEGKWIAECYCGNIDDAQSAAVWCAQQNESIATPGESIGPQNPARPDGGSSMPRESLTSKTMTLAMEYMREHPSFVGDSAESAIKNFARWMDAGLPVETSGDYFSQEYALGCRDALAMIVRDGGRNAVYIAQQALIGSPVETTCKHGFKANLCAQCQRDAEKATPKPTESELYKSSELFRHVWVCPMGWLGDKLIYGPGYTLADMKRWLIELRRLVGFDNPEGVRLELPENGRAEP